MKVIAIIQARMGSTRLPQKVLIDLCGKPMLVHIVERVKKSKKINNIVVATSNSIMDDSIEQCGKDNNFAVFRGEENDVLQRFYKCAVKQMADVVVRLTGDNALVDSGIIDQGLIFFEKNKYDYLKYRKGLPLGMAVEIFTMSALERSNREGTTEICREHVTPYMYLNPDIFNISEHEESRRGDYSQLRWTMDTEKDYLLIKNIYETIYANNPEFTWLDVVKQYQFHSEWKNINSDVVQKVII